MPITKLNNKLLTVWVVAGVVLEKDDKFLLVQEKKKRVYGLWNLPAGKVEKGSTIEETAVREAKEESGFDVRIIREIGVYHQETERAVKHAFLAEIIGGELNFPADEILDARWFSYQQILEMKDKLRNAYWILESIEKIRNARKS